MILPTKAASTIRRAIKQGLIVSLPDRHAEGTTVADASCRFGKLLVKPKSRNGKSGYFEGVPCRAAVRITNPQTGNEYVLPERVPPENVSLGM